MSLHTIHKPVPRDIARQIRERIDGGGAKAPRRAPPVSWFRSGAQARYAASPGSGAQARYAASPGSGAQARYAGLLPPLAAHLTAI